MKLLLFCPHFRPDLHAATGEVMTQLVEALAERGHNISVVTSLPWYRGHRVDPEWTGRPWRRERTDWGQVIRVWPFPTDKTNIPARALGFGGMTSLAAAVGLTLGHHDVVMAMSPPVFLGDAAWLVSRRLRAPLVFNTQDIFPDIAVELGALTDERVIGLARRHEASIYRRADAITVLSEDQARNVRSKIRSDTGQDPRRSKWRRLYREIGQDARRDGWREPTRDTGQDPRRDGWREPTRDTGQDPRRDGWREPTRHTAQDARRNGWREPTRHTAQDARRNGGKDKVQVIHNFVDLDRIKPTERENDYRRRNGLVGKTVVMYSGNVGLSQSFDLVRAAARRWVDDPEVVFVINGEGAARAEVESWAAVLDNVRVVDFGPRSEVPEILGAADLHLVLLKSGLARSSTPSKFYSILAAGRPVLASIDEGSEVSSVIKEHEVGRAVPPDDEWAFCGTLEQMLSEPTELAMMGGRARAFANRWLTPQAQAAAYEALFDRLIS